MVFLSLVSVTHGPLWSEDIKWKIAEIKFISFTFQTVLSCMMKSCTILLSPAQDVSHPFVWLIHAVYELPALESFSGCLGFQTDHIHITVVTV